MSPGIGSRPAGRGSSGRCPGRRRGARSCRSSGPSRRTGNGRRNPRTRPSDWRNHGSRPPAGPPCRTGKRPVRPRRPATARVQRRRVSPGESRGAWSAWQALSFRSASETVEALEHQGLTVRSNRWRHIVANPVPLANRSFAARVLPSLSCGHRRERWATPAPSRSSGAASPAVAGDPRRGESGADPQVGRVGRSGSDLNVASVATDRRRPRRQSSNSNAGTLHHRAFGVIQSGHRRGGSSTDRRSTPASDGENGRPMTGSSRPPGRSRIAINAASAGLVAVVSALAACGNAVWSAPPRYDGAGYAVLARALLEGQGYRAIDHPDRPRHAHFPPGYPLLLAAAWRLTGVSTAAAHAVSVLCTVGASLAAWCWFRRLMSRSRGAPPRAGALGQLALGAHRRRDPVRAALHAARPVDDPAGGAGRSCECAFDRGPGRQDGRPRHPAGRMPADPPGRRRPGDGRADRPGPAPIDGGKPWPSRGSPRCSLRPGWSGWRPSGRQAGPRPTCFSRGTAPGSSGSPGRSSSTSGASPTRSPARSSRSARSSSVRGSSAIAADVWAVAATAIIAFGWVRSLRRPRWRLAGLVAALHAARAALLAVHRGRPVPDPADPVHPGRRGRRAGRGAAARGPSRWIGARRAPYRRHRRGGG